jgi:hypothetical protein
VVTTEGGGSGRTPLEALLLALRHSRGAHLTGSTVLRQVLASSYREMIQGGTFDLASVWDLLSGQPKFDATEVMPAFAKVKSWEAKLGKTVKLPPSMQSISESELGEMAASIHVPATELAHVLRGGKVQTDHVDQIPEEDSQAGRRETPRMRKLARDTGAPAEPRAATKPPRPRMSPQRRRIATIAAGVVAALAFTFGAVTLSRGCQSRSWNQVALDFAGDIPLATAERSGPEVGATLREQGWARLPASRRKDQMSAALRALPAGVEVFFVRDRTGKVIAAARWYGKQPRQIDVTFR